jgi:hypothetical protein
MSSIRGINRYDQNRHMNYITTAAFGDSIFVYTTSQNPTTLVRSGALRSLLSVGTAAGATGYNTLGGSSPTAPGGRILRVNGRKLFPGANPCSTITVSSGGTSGTSSSSTVSQLYSQMVGVIDIVTGLSGFIDPNDSMFAIYNVDKAIDYPNDGSNPAHVAHKGPSIYTGGNVSVAGGIGVGPTASVAAQTAGTITTDGAITANGLITGNLGLTLPLGDLTVQTGKLYLTTSAGSASVGSATLASGTVTVSTTAVTANSRIFLTRIGAATGTGNYLAVGTITASTSFVINSYTTGNSISNDAGSVNWMIIN